MLLRPCKTAIFLSILLCKMFIVRFMFDFLFRMNSALYIITTQRSVKTGAMFYSGEMDSSKIHVAPPSDTTNCTLLTTIVIVSK